MSDPPDANRSAASPDPMFPTTKWSLVMRTRHDDPPVATRALGDLLRIYWKPLYVFARRSQMSPADAEDAVQSFYESLIRRDSLGAAEEQQGRLRSFLLTSFQNHLRTLHRHESRLKRGGGTHLLELGDAEASVKMRMVDDETPDRAFDRRWAFSLLEGVLQQLRQSYAERGAEETFAVLEPALVWNGAQMSYDQLAEKLKISNAAVAQAVRRMRARYRELLELAISDTVESPEAVAEERAYLVRVLSKQ